MTRTRVPLYAVLVAAVCLSLAALLPPPADAGVATTPRHDVLQTYTYHGWPMGSWQPFVGPGMNGCHVLAKFGNLPKPSGNPSAFAQIKYTGGSCSDYGVAHYFLTGGQGVWVPSAVDKCGVGTLAYKDGCIQLSDTSLFQQYTYDSTIVQMKVYVCTPFAVQACYEFDVDPFPS